MGADYRAYAIIGVMLPEDGDLPRAKITGRKRAYKHNFDDDGITEYHPKTGKKLWLDEKTEVEADYPAITFDEDESGAGMTYLEPPKGLEYHTGTDMNPRFLGCIVGTGNSNGGDDTEFSEIPDIKKIKEQIKALLEPLGIWDEKAFGLYANLYCSY